MKKKRKKHLARLLRNNVLVLEGDINYEMAKFVKRSLEELSTSGSPDINVVITSKGGDVSYGLLMHDMLRLYKGKKTCCVLGVANSMAAVILQVGDVRQCTANSNILLHDILSRISLTTLRDKELLEKRRVSMEKDQKIIYQIVSSRSSVLTMGSTRKLFSEDKSLTAEQAKEVGLIDEVL